MEQPGDEVVFANLAELMDHLEAATFEELADEIQERAYIDLPVLIFDDGGTILGISIPDGVAGVLLEFPMTEEEFWEVVSDHEEQVLEIWEQHDDDEP